MKKTLLLLCLVATFSLLFSSVTPVVFGGGGFSWVTADELIVDSKGIFNWNVGVAADIKLGETPIISEIGLRYISRGFLYKDSGGFDRTNVMGNYIGTLYYDCSSETRLHNIDIFAKAKYDIGVFSSISLLPYVGYATSYLLSSKETNEGDIYVVSYSYTNDTTDDFKTLDHLLLLGFDVCFSEKILVGVEYDVGLVSIMKNSNADKKSAVFMLNVGYMF